MSKQRILQVIGGGEIGGAERHLMTLMQRLDRGLFEVELLCLCPGPFAPLARENGITAHEIFMKHKLDIGTVGPIRQLLKERSIDLVHTHGMRANLVARLAAKKEGLPVVTTFHSILRYDYPTALEAAVARVLTRLTNGKSDRFIAVSGAIKEDLERMGVPGSRIQVIYNGLDTGRLAVTAYPEDVRKELGIPEGARVVGVVGRLHPVKGQVYFIKAARQLAGEFADLFFLLVGDGPDRPALEEKIKQSGLSGRVKMAGFYPSVSDVYQVLDVICIPSLMEGLPLVLLEAMYRGVPVVASRVGGIKEVVKNGENGLLVAPGEPEAIAGSVRRLLLDPELARRLADAARHTVQGFTIESMVRQTEDVYRSLLPG